MDIFNVIQTRLISEEKLPVAYAAIMTAQALNGFQPELKQAVQQWAEGKSVAQAALGDVTVADVQHEIGGSEFMAMCLLSMVKRYPGCFDKAILFLPKDQVSFDPKDLLSPDAEDDPESFDDLDDVEDSEE